MRRIWGGAGLVLVAAACAGSRSTAKTPAPQLDSWDLAPPGTYLAIGTRYGDWWELLERAEIAIKDAPGGDGQRAWLAAMLSYPRVAMRSESARRSTGIDDDGPHVSFFTPRGRLYVYRVADRAAYRRTLEVKPEPASRGRLTVDGDGDTCAAIDGFQACGPRELLLDVIAGKRLAIPWPEGRQPTVRVWAAPSLLGGLAAATEGGDGLRVEVDVGRGELRARGHLSGKTAGLVSFFGATGASPLARRLPRDELSGAAVLNLTGWFQRTRQTMVENLADQPLTAKVSQGALLGALRGDAVMWVVRGDRAGGIAIGLEKVDVARRLLAACEELSGRVPGLRIARDGAACRLRHEALASLGTGEVTVSIKEDALVAEMIGTGAPPPRRPGAARAGMLERVRAGDDGLAMWGSGLFALLARANLATRSSSPDPFFAWLLLQVTESGGAIRVDPDGIRAELTIRTAAAYDDPAQAALAPLLVRLARGEDVGADAFDRLSAAHSRSRLADDLAQGSGGSVVPLLAGIFVALAGVEFGREMSAAAAAGEEVVRAYEEVVEKACRCKDAGCAERAVERLQAWEAQHGETAVDALSLARITELTRESSACLAPFFPDQEEGGDGGE